MDTVGQILKAAREKRGDTINEIAIHTKIGSRYLSALEEDRYEAFPSETHITGFIRSYAKYLELDPDHLIGIYKRILLQEAPTPIEELTAPRKQHVNPAFLIAVFVGILIIAIPLIFILGHKKSGETVLDDDSQSSRQQDTPSPERSFSQGDFIPVMIAGEEKRLVFDALTPETVTVSYAGQRYPLAVGETHSLDFNKDGNFDVRIQIKNVVDQKMHGSVTLGKQPVPEETNETNKPAEHGTSGAGKAILKADEQVEIRLTITANGMATVNTLRDNNERSDFFLKKGDKITILAKDTVQLTASNPNNLLLNLNNVNLSVDTKSPAAGFLFKWRRNPADGLFYLEYEQLR
ncbi:MAG TPA: helix-turn-helix domain-containing protein [Spirochaetota bacterium]|nr:helix-turn-helix domain-containing protein [Spirochaetota bacterium]HPH02386.1 helix-turn-helix domain-containing protein [Spirochaetota bacterium]HPN82937.1 helix-turn-helix domain-containing protein [Spirochaetota bacterium]